MKKPAFDEVREYFAERGHVEEAEAFYDHFESNGWKVSGRAPMKDWKAAVRQWLRNDFRKKPKSGGEASSRLIEMLKEE